MKMEMRTAPVGKKEAGADVGRRRKIGRKSLLLAAFFYVFSLSGVVAGERMKDKAVFAAGCFWGVEKVFSSLPGVLSTQVGYTGGTKASPTYEEVCSGLTGHAEAIEVEFDPSFISYGDLVEVFFRHHDPTTPNRQGNDIGTQYRSVIFTRSPEQEQIARQAVVALDKARIFKSPVVTQVTPAGPFYSAEEYHQKYLKKNPNGYCSLQLQPAKVGEVLKFLKDKKKKS